jgi:hypothetical protein
MAKLTAKQRNAIPSSAFGLPKTRQYPEEDKSHAANAKARAAQQVKKGNLTAGQEKQIDTKANRVLGKPSPAKKGK